MDVQFEATCTYTKEQRVEFYRYAMRKRIGWVIFYAVTGVLVAILAILRQSALWAVAGIFELAYGLWIYFRPWIFAAKSEKTEKKFYGNECPPPSVTTFGEEIQDVGIKQTISIPYDKITGIHISKTMVFLIDVRNVTIMVDKDGFQKGTYEEFRKFIREKCPQAKITVS